MSNHTEVINKVLSAGFSSFFLSAVNNVANASVIDNIAADIHSVTLTKSTRTSTLPHKCFDYEFDNDDWFLVAHWYLYRDIPLVARPLRITIGPYSVSKFFTAPQLENYLDSIRSTILCKVAPLMTPEQLVSLFHEGKLTLPVHIEVRQGRKIPKNHRLITLPEFRERILEFVQGVFIHSPRAKAHDLYSYLKIHDSVLPSDFGITDLDKLVLVARLVHGFVTDRWEHPWDHDLDYPRFEDFKEFLKDGFGVVINRNDPVATIRAAIIAFGGNPPK